MELRSLEYFLACVEKGSLTGAAESLYTTQPHVSQVIKSLEWELGVKLFRRTGSGIELTDDGEVKKGLLEIREMISGLEE